MIRANATKSNTTLLLNPKLTNTIIKFSSLRRKLQQSISSGWGECMVNNCHCRAFEGNDATCSNCGHNKERHW